jgi:CRISPR-associated protein Cas1
MQLHINSYGAYLHLKDAIFVIRTKQADGKWASSNGVAAHKVKSIWMGPGTALSSDAVALALRNNIDIVFLENSGRPLGRIWHAKLGSTTRIRKCQIEASLDYRAVYWTCKWLAQKLENQAGFIRDLTKHRAQYNNYLKEKIGRIDALRATILSIDNMVLDEALAGTLHGLEGTAGRLYFETLSFVLPVSWKFEGRSSRPARDPFNAFLNYAYGVLYARVEKALMLAGLDPYAGFLHRDDYNHKSMVYDFIEPYRLWGDKVVFTLFSGKKVNQQHTDPITGGFALSAEGKRLLMNAYNEYLESNVIRYKGRNRTRANIILLDAHRFAQEILGKSTEALDLEIETI